MQREAAEGESKNVSEAKKRVAENESSANMAEASYRAEAHVSVSARDTVVLSLRGCTSVRVTGLSTERPEQ